MRYNPETERGILLDNINRQCWNAVEERQVQSPALIDFRRVWDCRNGGWTTTVR